MMDLTQETVTTRLPERLESLLGTQQLRTYPRGDVIVVELPAITDTLEFSPEDWLSFRWIMGRQLRRMELEGGVQE